MSQGSAVTQDVVTAEHGKWVDHRGDSERMPFGNRTDIFLFRGENEFIPASFSSFLHTQGTRITAFFETEK